MCQELDKGTSMTIRKTTAALAFAAALFSGVAYAEVVATVSGLTGSATVTPVGGGVPFTVADGYQLQRGETLTLGANSNLTLTYTVGCPGGAATCVSQLAAGNTVVAGGFGTGLTTAAVGGGLGGVGAVAGIGGVAGLAGVVASNNSSSSTPSSP